MVSDSGLRPALAATPSQGYPVNIGGVMSCPCREGPCLLLTRQMRRGPGPCMSQGRFSPHTSSTGQPPAASQPQGVQF